MPSAIRQTQKDKFCLIPLTRSTLIGKFIKTESRLEVIRGWGMGRMGSFCLMDIVSVWHDEKVLGRESADDCTTL